MSAAPGDPGGPHAHAQARTVYSAAQAFVDAFEEVASTVATLDVLAGFADLVAVAPAEYVRHSTGRTHKHLTLFSNPTPNTAV